MSARMPANPDLPEDCRQAEVNADTLKDDWESPRVVRLSVKDTYGKGAPVPIEATIGSIMTGPS